MLSRKRSLNYCGSHDHTEAELVLNTLAFPQNEAKFLYFLDSAAESD